MSKRIALAVVFFAGSMALSGVVAAASPQTVILMVDVGSGASIGIGPGGMAGSVMTGGGPVSMMSGGVTVGAAAGLTVFPFTFTINTP